jgi:hypothetical protein
LPSANIANQQPAVALFAVDARERAILRDEQDLVLVVSEHLGGLAVAVAVEIDLLEPEGHGSARRPKKSAASTTTGSSRPRARTDRTLTREVARSNSVTLIQPAS